jgi:hypothetical protein
VYARSTTVLARADAIDAGIRHLRDRVMPSVLDMDGCVGLSLIVDRDSRRCIATTSWTEESAMRAAERKVETIRNDAAEQFGGTVQKVERWEIAAMHREHAAGDGGSVRCTWLQVPDVERSIDAFRTRVLPRVEEMDGFCSASFFVERANGRACSAIAWDGRSAMDASRDAMSELRTSVTTDLGGDVLEVAEFELAIAHLRAPELV